MAKTIKVKSEFGIVDAKVKKVFEFENHKFAVVDFPSKYMNSPEPVYTHRVVEYGSGATIPVYGKHKQTIKDFVENALVTLRMIYRDLGEEEFKKTISQSEVINQSV